AGGATAPASATAQLRRLLAPELARGDEELARDRTGYPDPIVVAFAGADGVLAALLPVPSAFTADPARATERAWTLTAACVPPLAELAELGRPARAADLALRTAEWEAWLVLEVAHPGLGHEEAELAALELQGTVERTGRLRADVVALPAHVLAG